MNNKASKLPLETRTMLQKLPAIQELRKQGWKVRCLYFRLENGVTWRHSTKDIRKYYHHYLKPANQIYGAYMSSKGGKVLVDLRTPTGREVTGESVCSPKDNFEKFVGRSLALKRALEKTYSKINYENKGSL